MVRSSGQHKCGLMFCGVMMLVLGTGVTVTGFLNEFLDPYDETVDSGGRFFTHTQYYLGIPLFLFGFYVIATSCSKVGFLMVWGFIMASIVLLLSIFAVILEGPVWRDTLRNAMIISERDSCPDTERGICSCLGSNLSCDERKYLAVIYTFMVACSTFAALVCLFCIFIYFRVLGWMSHINYGDPIDDYYARAVNSHFINGQHGRGIGRANDVAMGSYPH